MQMRDSGDRLSAPTVRCGAAVMLRRAGILALGFMAWVLLGWLAHVNAYADAPPTAPAVPAVPAVPTVPADVEVSVPAAPALPPAPAPVGSEVVPAAPPTSPEQPAPPPRAGLPTSPSDPATAGSAGDPAEPVDQGGGLDNERTTDQDQPSLNLPTTEPTGPSPPVPDPVSAHAPLPDQAGPTTTEPTSSPPPATDSGSSDPSAAATPDPGAPQPGAAQSDSSTTVPATTEPATVGASGPSTAPPPAASPTVDQPAPPVADRPAESRATVSPWTPVTVELVAIAPAARPAASAGLVRTAVGQPPTRLGGSTANQRLVALPALSAATSLAGPLGGWASFIPTPASFLDQASQCPATASSSVPMRSRLGAAAVGRRGIVDRPIRERAAPAVPVQPSAPDGGEPPWAASVSAGSIGATSTSESSRDNASAAILPASITASDAPHSQSIGSAGAIAASSSLALVTQRPD